MCGGAQPYAGGAQAQNGMPSRGAGQPAIGQPGMQTMQGQPFQQTTQTGTTTPYARWNTPDQQINQWRPLDQPYQPTTTPQVPVGNPMNPGTPPLQTMGAAQPGMLGGIDPAQANVAQQASRPMAPPPQGNPNFMQRGNFNPQAPAQINGQNTSAFRFANPANDQQKYFNQLAQGGDTNGAMAYIFGAGNQGGANTDALMKQMNGFGANGNINDATGWHQLATKYGSGTGISANRAEYLKNMAIAQNAPGMLHGTNAPVR